MLVRTLIFALMTLLGAVPAMAQSQQLTLDDLYHPDRKKDFSGSRLTFRTWLDSEHYSERVRGERVVKVHALSGDTSPLMEREPLQEAFARLPGFSQDEAKKASHTEVSASSADGSLLLFNFGNDLFLYRSGGDVMRLTDTPQIPEQEEDFSPDARMVSFVRGYNLYVIDLERVRERRLTEDGGGEIYNGVLDWVYQEEVYGRGNFRAYWWSPDSSGIAYLQLDETKVPHFNVIDHRPVHLETEVMRYPKAGDPNPGVRLGMVSAAGGETHWIDLSAYGSQEILIVRVGWSPDAEHLLFQVQDREQTWLDLNAVQPGEGAPRTVIREESPAWVNVLGQPEWLEDGSFLWMSERTGWSHLYSYGSDFQLKGALTEGEWDVTDLHGSDGQWVYFTATQHDYTERHVYRVGMDGEGLKRLSQRAGTHSARFNPDCTLYIDSWSDFDTPTQVRLFRAGGQEARVIDANPVEALKEYDLPPLERHQVKTRDGFVMEAMMIKPPDFDESKKYPVMSHTYSGPQAPQVRNGWAGTRMLWHRMLAQKGYVIWICDNRSASAKGVRSAWPVHRNLGELELRDLEDGLDWLRQKPWVDASRIGLWGWSYGGYMTSYALTHSDSFKIGIAGAPVTDWHLYDTIYTERYMGRPQTNPEGYEKSSPLEAAGDLKGKLLIVHGTIDDNVHMQNSIQFVDRLQQADKSFQLMLYPGSRHGVRDPWQVYHLQKLMTAFILDNL
ncbi:MAG TPA: DPP IV N-terminal domain-containing protein [Acidobacteriota bacterium]|nr:DPP IV N-terminal domain-containing protein [Acidobacteriota bacterium]